MTLKPSSSEASFTFIGCRGQRVISLDRRKQAFTYFQDVRPFAGESPQIVHGAFVGVGEAVALRCLEQLQRIRFKIVGGVRDAADAAEVCIDGVTWLVIV